MISIIIINYNLSDEVRSCVESLLNYCGTNGYELILFENGSTQKSIHNLSLELENKSSLKFHYIESKINLGFGQACNKAAKQATNDILFFLNPDTLIENNLIDLLNKNVVAEISKHNFIAGLKVNSTKLFDFSAGYFPNLFFEFMNVFLIGRFVEAFLIKLKTQFRKSNIQTDWVMGSAFLIKKDLFELLSGFAPEYFLYFEEMDLCKRAKNRGVEVKYFHQLTVNHLGSVGSKKNYYFFTLMFYKGKLLFLKKHKPKTIFKLYELVIRIQFYVQIIFYSFFRFKFLNIADDKIRAYRYLLTYLNCPEKISNNFNS
jgi:GT2 family glycosyltransferase